MYAVGALLALVAILLRVRLPESPRWLVGKGRLAEADAVVSDMEKMASRHGPLAAPSEDVPVDSPSSDGHTPYATLLGSRVYLLRVLLLLSVWFLAYITVFCFGAGFTSLLTALKYPPPAAGVIVAVGAFGFLACALFAAAFAERLERKLWLPIGALITIIGGVIVAEAGTSRPIAFIGAAVVFFGFNVWVPMTYALSTESFPTRARATGFALVDGVGHFGGGIGVLLIVPLIPHLTVLGAFMLIGGFLVLAAVLAQFALNTRARHYEELAP
jgi:predicted MFS family arabinose efflux permease